MITENTTQCCVKSVGDKVTVLYSRLWSDLSFIVLPNPLTAYTSTGIFYTQCKLNEYIMYRVLYCTEFEFNIYMMYLVRVLNFMHH